METKSTENSPGTLIHEDGEVNGLLRTFDWNRTGIAYLKTATGLYVNTINTCLQSQLPTLLLLGDDLAAVYNQPAARQLGLRHPHAFGAKAKDIWKEFWDDIGPMLESVLKDGRSFLAKDRKFISLRNGYPEECYFSFSYSPFYLSSNYPEGVLVTAIETTSTVRDLQQLRIDRNKQIEELFMHAPIGLCILSGENHIVEIANEGMLRLWGVSRDEVINKPLFTAVPDVARQGFENYLQRVLQHGERIVLDEAELTTKRNGKTNTVNLKVVYQPMKENDGTITGVLALAEDITEQVTARRRQAEELTRLVEARTADLNKRNEELKRSEERYHRMVNEIQDYAIILLNKNGDIENWNAGAELIKGYKANEVIGKNFRIFYKKEDRDRNLPETLLNKARKEGRSQHEGWRVRKDGTEFWGSITITALHDNDNNVIGFSKITRDLTEKKKAEDQLHAFAAQLKQSNALLQKSEERYHKMIAEVQDYAIILLDKDGHIENWNAGAEFIKGYKASEVIGKHFRIFYPEEDRENKTPEQLLLEASRHGKAAYEGWRVRKDGSTFWGSMVLTALHDSRGDVIGFSKVTRDLTEKKRAEDKLKEYAAELEMQNRELEQFAYIASHDLQEPLRKIQTFTEIIQRHKGDEVQMTRYFGKINASAQRMSELIKSVLNYSRLSRDERQVPTDLNVVVQNVINELELLIQEKQAVINYSHLPTIKAIPLQLTQLVSNLLGNALKFTERPPVVKISSRVVDAEQLMNKPNHIDDGEFYEISFSDNGIGFDERYEKQIFAMFQRLHGKHEYAGTGIGLALCKRIAENHNGYITATSEPGNGSTFYVYFPRDRS